MRRSQNDRADEDLQDFQVLEDEVAIPDHRLTSKQIPYPIVRAISISKYKQSQAKEI